MKTIPVLTWIGAAAGLAILIASAWRLSGCRHPGRLGLMPPVRNPDGSRTVAQWYCDACGRSWPANLEQPRRIVQKFAGHDEQKASDAAQRADALAARRRQDAVARSGVPPPGSTPRKVVPIRTERRG